MRWDALWTNVRLATMAGGARWGAIDDGALAVADGRIAWVGPRGDLPAEATTLAATVHDADGRWMTPGLVDCHTHIVFAGSRRRDFEMRIAGAGRAEMLAAGGGIPATVRATRAATEDALLAGALPRIDRLRAEGVTTVEIKSGYGLDRDTELRQLRVARRIGGLRPVRVVTAFLGMHGLPPGHEGPADTYVDFVCRESLPAAVAEGLVDIVDGCVERVAFDAALSTRVWRVAERLGKPIKAHADQYADAGGGAAVAACGGLSADHLECASEESLAAMARAGTVATLLPGSTYTLRDPNRPPVARLRRLGIPMALATNCNPGSSPTASPLLVMNMACTLFGLTPEEALAGFTRHAAAAVGLAGEVGTLEAGKAADLVEWDVDDPADLAYWLAIGNPCRRVFRDGRLVADAHPGTGATPR